MHANATQHYVNNVIKEDCIKTLVPTELTTSAPSAVLAPGYGLEQVQGCGADF